MALKAGANAAYVRASDGMSALKFALWVSARRNLSPQGRRRS